MANIPAVVHQMLTNDFPPKEWKLQELRRLLYEEECSMKENKKVVETLEGLIENNPDSPKLADWQRSLGYNQHDYELHQNYCDRLIEAIHDLKDSHDATQLEMF